MCGRVSSRGHGASSYSASSSETSAGGDSVVEWRLGSVDGDEGRPISSQEGGCWGSGSGYSNLPVSTTMVEEEDVARCTEALIFLSPVLDDFSIRQLGLPAAPSCNCVNEGRLVLTIFPLASLQSLFLVANMPRPSPPASSSFSLWRAMCLSGNEDQSPLPPWNALATHLEGHGAGNGHYTAGTYYCRPCGSMHGDADALIWKMTFHSLESCSRTFS